MRSDFQAYIWLLGGMLTTVAPTPDCTGSQKLETI